MNYVAYGEYIAYSRQSRDAAGRRSALIGSMFSILQAYTENPSLVPDIQLLQHLIAQYAISDREMRAAYLRANQSAALCGEHKMTLTELSSPIKPLLSGCQAASPTVQK